MRLSRTVSIGPDLAKTTQCLDTLGKKIAYPYSCHFQSPLKPKGPPWPFSAAAKLHPIPAVVNLLINKTSLLNQALTREGKGQRLKDKGSVADGIDGIDA